MSPSSPATASGPRSPRPRKRVLDATGVEFDWDVQEAGVDVMATAGHAAPRRVLESIRRQQGRPQGADHHAGRHGLPQRQRRSAQGARPLRLRAPVQELRGRAHALQGHRPRHRPREHRGPVRRHRVREGQPENAEADAKIIERARRGRKIRADSGISIKPISRHGHAAHRPVRLRVRAEERPQEGHGRPQGEHHEVHRRPVPRASPPRSPKDYPDIEFEDGIVDNMCMQLVQKPELYDVLVLPNLYGDILSATCAPAWSAASASRRAPTSAPTRRVFEATHGSAPKYKGQNKVNPTALILSGMLMLEHLGETDAAERLEGAVAEVIREGKDVTYDMKPNRNDPTAVGTVRDGRRDHREAEGDCVSDKEAAPRRRHRRRRPDRLRLLFRIASARCSARTSRSSCSCSRSPSRRPEGAQGRRHGARRLRLPAAAGHGPDRTTPRWLQGRQLGPAGRLQAARAGHGARRPAEGQRQDLHRPGQGDRRGRRRRRPRAPSSATPATPTA